MTLRVSGLSRRVSKVQRGNVTCRGCSAAERRGREAPRSDSHSQAFFLLTFSSGRVGAGLGAFSRFDSIQLADYS